MIKTLVSLALALSLVGPIWPESSWDSRYWAGVGPMPIQKCDGRGNTGIDQIQFCPCSNFRDSLYHFLRLP